MREYKKHNWTKIFEAFLESDLNQSQFCKQQGLNPKYFNQKYSKHRKQTSAPNRSKGSKFTPVQLAKNRSTNEASGLSLTVGRCTIHCPEHMPLESLCTLVRSLA